MNRSVEATGKTVEEAIAEALAELDIDEQDADIQVLDEGARGLFGLVARREARVRVTARHGETEVETEVETEDRPDKVSVVRDVVSKLAELMGMTDVHTRVHEDELGRRVEVGGQGASVMIGRRGQTLDAVQYLVNVIGTRASEDRVPVAVDVDGYRRRREQTLRQLADRAADRARRSGSDVRLDPMSGYERRVVHMALQADDSVYTESEGEDPFRRVVVSSRRPGDA